MEDPELQHPLLPGNSNAGCSQSTRTELPETSEEGPTDPSLAAGIFQALLIVAVYVLPIVLACSLEISKIQCAGRIEGERVLVGFVFLMVATVMTCTFLPISYEGIFLGLVRMIGGSTPVDECVLLSRDDDLQILYYRVAKKWYSIDIIGKLIPDKLPDRGSWSSVLSRNENGWLQLKNAKARLEVWNLNPARPFFLDVDGATCGHSDTTQQPLKVGNNQPTVRMQQPHMPVNNRSASRTRKQRPLEALLLRVCNAAEPTCRCFVYLVGIVFMVALFAFFAAVVVALLGISAAIAVGSVAISIQIFCGLTDCNSLALGGVAFCVHLCWQLGGCLFLWFFIEEPATCCDKPALVRGVGVGGDGSIGGTWHRVASKC